MLFECQGDTEGHGYHAQTADVDDDIEYVLGQLPGEAVDEAGHEPLEDPH